MKKGIIGKKIGMTQIFDEKGKVIPVTVIEAGPCVIVQKKTVESDGYNALQVGFGDLKPAKVNKPMQGHFAKGDVAAKRVLKEFRMENVDDANVGDILKADVFADGEIVDVTGTSKGKGFQGTIKRFNNARLKETHGTGPVHRHAGSMGHMGSERVTVQNLVIAKVDAENNLIAVKGAVPGPKGGTVVIRNSVKKA